MLTQQQRCQAKTSIFKGRPKQRCSTQTETREKRHIGLEDEEEDSEPAPHRQKRHHECNFIIGGNTSGDSATSRKKWANAAMVNKVLVPEGDTKVTRKLDMEFVVVGIISNTNIILGRLGLEDLECVISPRHLCIKFPTPHGVGIAKGSQRVSRAWYLKATKQPIKYDTQVGEVTAQLLRAEERRPRVEVVGDIEEFELEPGTPGRKVFAWSPADMPGLDHKIAVHRLNVLRDAKLVKQKRRHLSQERRDFVKKENAEADVLSKLSAESPEYIRKLATVEELATPSLNRDEMFWVLADPPEWLDRLAKYIEDGVAPEDPQEAHLLRMSAPTYKVHDGVLYKRSYNSVLLRCLRAAEAKALMEEIHEGVCAAHQGPYSISRRAIIQGYFLPTMRKDCEEYLRKCPTCQQFQNMPGRPATNYTLISSVIPFSTWGIDIVGALPKGVGQARWIVVAIDYFTKWVEAEPLAGITGRQMIDFVGTNILCRFGVPKQIISDNGTQFEEAEFQDFLKTWGIHHTKVSVAYPQANGQVENVNRTIISGIKKKLLSEGSKWVDEVPRILWTYRTTPRRATGDTPFGLATKFVAI
ncbi:unnamed protein product [Cuscuta campestris]|uniref:Integrase catalytic domain-containing protein n=1 Tax=Cuscuta campestris TaxID=132261 RepID=A0A484N768_9ASTE|nr:unnamed protein product [Cuscuta campestris]